MGSAADDNPPAITRSAWPKSLSRRTLPTLDEALRRHRGVGPGFHMLRHLLSFLILAHHCRLAVIGIHTDDTYSKGARMTLAAAHRLSGQHLAIELLRPGLFTLVGMFFGLSGFLVAGSALRNMRIGVFFANRALRILPALSVEISLSALVLGPVITTLPLHTYLRSYQFYRYFGNVVGHVTFQLPGVFTANPWPDMVNANLWTLPPEFWCYAFMLVLMFTGLLLRTRLLTIAVVVVGTLWLGLSLYDNASFPVRSDATHYNQWYIVLLFFYGVAFFINAKRVPLHPLLFVISACSYYALTMLDALGPLTGFFLTYCMIYIGMSSFSLFDRLVKVDLSYGTYLYGFPITQACVFFLLPRMSGLPRIWSFVIMFPLVLALTVLFSYLSWTYIEKPALGLRKHVIREPALKKG